MGTGPPAPSGPHAGSVRGVTSSARFPARGEVGRPLESPPLWSDVPEPSGPSSEKGPLCRALRVRRGSRQSPHSTRRVRTEGTASVGPCDPWTGRRPAGGGERRGSRWGGFAAAMQLPPGHLDARPALPPALSWGRRARPGVPASVPRLWNGVLTLRSAEMAVVYHQHSRRSLGGPSPALGSAGRSRLPSLIPPR